MSDINVNYNINYSPNPITTGISVRLNGTQASIAIVNVPPVLVTATPNYSANIGSDLLSTIGTPMINAVTATCGAFASDILNNKSFDIFNVPAFGFDVAGGHVTLTPANLSLGNFNGMLMLTGDLAIS